jgi:hypothetical protein
VLDAIESDVPHAARGAEPRLRELLHDKPPA